MSPPPSFFSLPVLLLLLLSSLSPTTALYFRLTSLAATVTTIPTSSCPPSSEAYYNISFAASNPDAVWEQGGSGEVKCEITWQSPSPPQTCWHPCPASSSSSSSSSPTGFYYTRLSPSPSSSSPSVFNLRSFSLSLWQGYIYEIGNHNNATITLLENSGSKGMERWTCEGHLLSGNGGKVERCRLMVGEGEGVVLREVGVWHDGSEPEGVCGRDV